MRSALSGLLGCVICGMVLLGPPLSSQRSPQTDSARAVQSARRAQQGFESFRKQNLPRHHSNVGPPCDEKVGRFCYWHTDEDSIVPEPKSITRERERLLNKLDRFAAIAPRDDWIAGQRVRYLVEAGYDSSAVLAAYECRGTPWWCQALRGFALHSLRRYESAEAEFDSMLVKLPEKERCRWRDLSLLLTHEERDAYTKTPCASRDEFERRFWQLADPLYVVDGNDRRTEHFSRLVLARLMEKSANAYGLTWGDDMRELMIRYGVPISYTTSWPSTYSHQYETPVTGHEREPCFHFAAHFAGSDSTRWEFKDPLARERYSPPYIDTLILLSAQFAMFKRGDSALVVAAYSDSGQTITRMGIAGFSARALPDDTVTAPAPGNRHVRYAKGPWRGMAVGIEQFDESRRRLAQQRSWLAPPRRGTNAPQLSTILLFIGDDTSASPTLDAAARAALTSNDLHGTRKLGVYWEMYNIPTDSTPATPIPQGLDSVIADSLKGPLSNAPPGTSPDTVPNAPSNVPADTLSETPLSASSATPAKETPTPPRTPDSALPVSITVFRIDGGFGRWLSQALRLTPRDMPIAVGWSEVPGVRGVLYRSVVLDLAQLPKGRYQIEVAVGDAPHQSITSREFRLR